MHDLKFLVFLADGVAGLFALFLIVSAVSDNQAAEARITCAALSGDFHLTNIATQQVWSRVPVELRTDDHRRQVPYMIDFACRLGKDQNMDQIGDDLVKVYRGENPFQ